ncbi:DUF3592 domain-containing protein [Streptomyces sp. NPDC090025]|uniref:DUF3592 domain-containing protein n=1 Tax=Streptomyces sp. NPDC090025 TaxID=3365922 RepID=UPI003836C305
MGDVSVWAWVCVGWSVLLAGVGCREFGRVRRLRRDGIVTRGVIVGERPVPDVDVKAYSPVVAYRDERGVEVRFTQVTHGSGPRPVIGREVDVIRLPGQPESARIMRWRHMSGQGVVMLVGAAVFLGGAYLIATQNN